MARVITMDMPTTSILLLARLGENDPAAWASFVRRYGPPVIRWCRQRGLQDADAEDVAQEVLARLARRMHRTSYDPVRPFRAWLMGVVRNVLADWSEERGRSSPGADLGLNPNLVPGPDLLAEWIEAEHERERFEVAAERVRARVEPRTYEAFRLMTLEGLKGADVADRLGISLHSAHQARSRVLKAVREEVDKLGVFA